MSTPTLHEPREIMAALVDTVPYLISVLGHEDLAAELPRPGAVAPDDVDVLANHTLIVKMGDKANGALYIMGPFPIDAPAAELVPAVLISCAMRMIAPFQ